MITDDAGLPWRQVEAILRGQITSGELTGRLPSEKTIAQQYGVSVKTVRKAMAALRGDGLIRTERGWGSYVPGKGSPS